MPGVTIGTSFNNGFPGTFGQQGPKIVSTAPNTGDAEMNFGSPIFGLISSTTGAYGVAAAGSTGLTPTAVNFKGVAEAHVTRANEYIAQSLGGYLTNDAVPCFEQGGIVVYVGNSAVNAPAIDGDVYVRIAGGTDSMPVGEFEAAPDGTTPANTIQITNATWGSTADSNGVALLILKTRNNA
jgi:hypothetical protein